MAYFFPGADPFFDCYYKTWSVAFGPPPPAQNIQNETSKRELLLNVIVGMFPFGGRGPAVEKTAFQLVGSENVRNRTVSLFNFIAGSPRFVIGSHPRHLHLTPIRCMDVPTVVPWKAPKYEVLRPSDM